MKCICAEFTLIWTKSISLFLSEIHEFFPGTMTTVSVVCSMCSKNLERTQFSRTQLKKGSKKKSKNCIKGFHQIQSKKNQPESQDKHQETFVTTKYEIKFWDCPRCDVPRRLAAWPGCHSGRHTCNRWSLWLRRVPGHCRKAWSDPAWPILSAQR